MDTAPHRAGRRGHSTSRSVAARPVKRGGPQADVGGADAVPGEEPPMVDPFVTPLLTLKYKGLLASSNGHGIGVLAQAAVHAAQSVGTVAALKMVAQMLIVLGTAAAGVAAHDRARKALRALVDGDVEKAFKHGRKAL